MFDLEPNYLSLDGIYTVLKIEEDTLNKKLWYHVDTLNYIRNTIVNGVQVQDTLQLAINDELIINHHNLQLDIRLLKFQLFHLIQD
jgi:hypothetical protein